MTDAAQNDSGATDASPAPASAPKDWTSAQAADPLLASFIAASRPTQSAGAGQAAAGEASAQDAVALIGAALASASGRAEPPATRTSSVASKSGAGADIPLATADEGPQVSAVHVVAQETWLQPVSPTFSPGLNRLAAADRSTIEGTWTGQNAAKESAASKETAKQVDAAKLAAASAAAPLASSSASAPADPSLTEAGGPMGALGATVIADAGDAAGPNSGATSESRFDRRRSCSAGGGAAS